MGTFITASIFPRLGPRLGPTLGLAWLLAACSTAPPMVADRAVNLSRLMQADERSEPSSHDLIARAGSAAAEGRYAEAEAYLDAALSVDPHDNRALRRLAAIYLITGRPERARLHEQLTRGVDVADSGPWTAGAGETPFPIDANNFQRFVALDRLFDAELITEEEYEARREANLGALLPLTQPSSSLDAGRRPPLVRDLVERLETIARFRKTGALDDHGYAVERNAVLEGLMPMPKSDRRSIASVTPEALDPETHQLWLDRLLAAKLITRLEYENENAVLIGLYAPAAGAMEDADSAPPGLLSMNDRPMTVIDETAMTRQEAVAAAGIVIPEAEAAASADQDEGDAEPQLGSLAGDAANPNDPAAPASFAARIDIHLALSRTPESAQRSWETLQQANGLALDGLIPRVSRVDLGGGKGIFFQLSAGPLADMAAAEALCGELLSRDFYCAPLVF